MPIPEAEFRAVLAAAQSGDAEAAAVLYRSLQPSLVRYLRVHAPGDAEDLAAEVWYGVARNLRTFTGDEPAFRGWVFTIASRRLRDRGRRRTRRPEVLLPPGSLHPGTAPGADTIAVSNLSAQEAVELLVRRLPPDMAEVLLLRVVADLPVSEVAQVMGRTPGSVRVLQHRALKRAAEVLQGVVEPSRRPR